MTEAAPTTGWYVYGIVEAGQPPASLAETVEIGGSPGAARLIESGGLAAIVSEVDLDEFDEAALPVRLNDPVWLEEKARAHERVLEAAALDRTVVPLRFGTIFRHPDEVRKFIAGREATLTEAVERVRGRVELGVKAWADQTRLEAAWNEEASSETTAEEPGRAYLLQRSRDKERDRELAALCEQVVNDAHRRLSALAVAGVVNRTQSRELSGRAEQMLLNAAYLVESGDSGVQATVAALDAEQRSSGISFELTGPWPPYNFVDLAVAEEAR